MLIGNREFDVGNKCYIMGILNVTPDSFSDGGMFDNLDEIVRHTGEMITNGADIIDVGGMSTRPGYKDIEVQEELDRVLPVIEALTKRFDIPISIDTHRSDVADGALLSGAVMVNDIWGLKFDPKMVEIIKKHNAACCLMHNRQTIDYKNFLAEVVSDLQESVNIALKNGISSSKIILDPGIGFAKTYEMNLKAINRLDLIVDIGYPVLLGASRKSVIGLTLDLSPSERIEGTVATSVIAVMRKCSFVRVHDVLETKRAILMTEAILNA
jgi:dihydropteroate synthase